MRSYHPILLGLSACFGYGRRHQYEWRAPPVGRRHTTGTCEVALWSSGCVDLLKGHPSRFGWPASAHTQFRRVGGLDVNANIRGGPISDQVDTTVAGETAFQHAYPVH